MRCPGRICPVMRQSATSDDVANLRITELPRKVRGQGFEPRFTGPEPGVLPLDDPRTLSGTSAY